MSHHGCEGTRNSSDPYDRLCRRNEELTAERDRLAARVAELEAERSAIVSELCEHDLAFPRITMADWLTEIQDFIFQCLTKPTPRGKAADMWIEHAADMLLKIAQLLVANANLLRTKDAGESALRSIAAAAGLPEGTGPEEVAGKVGSAIRELLDQRERLEQMEEEYHLGLPERRLADDLLDAIERLAGPTAAEANKGG